MQDKHSEGEAGQATVMAALAMSIFLIGAVGLAIDGSHIYAEFQMAQTAADAAAQASMMSIFDGTNGTGPARFSTGSSFNCNVGNSDPRTPCAYAAMNGFGTTAAGSPRSTDTVTVTFPTNAPPNVTLSTNPEDIGPGEIRMVQVTVTRPVLVTLMGILGAASPTISATATAAIVNVPSPAPLVVTHPSMWGPLSMKGGGTLTISGGPCRAIQINSDNGTPATSPGGGTIDLSTAGPPGGCGGTGGDLGVWRGPNTSAINLTPAGNYVQPSSPVLDPLAIANMPASAIPATAAVPTVVSPNNGCPPQQACQLYYPGTYNAGNVLNGNGFVNFFSPGIYYISGGGITCSINCSMSMSMSMATGTGSDPITGWPAGNMMFYIAPGGGSVNIGAGGAVNLTGSPLIISNATYPYPGILFFGDHGSTGNTIHTLGGGTSMTLNGSIYLTTANPTVGTYQILYLSGPANITGHVIVDALTVTPGSGISIDLDNAAPLSQRQVAMVN